MAFEGDVATVTESADLRVSTRPATRQSAWTSGNTESTRISFEAVHDQHPPTAKAEVNPGSQSYPRSRNHAGNVPLQRLTARGSAGRGRGRRPDGARRAGTTRPWQGWPPHPEPGARAAATGPFRPPSGRVSQ